jgi:type I restriction enzyme S subunit
MELSTFFEKFDQFADAPDAVPKLRELVLELAVRGRLSERRTEDKNDPAWRAFIDEFDNRIYSYDPAPPPPFEVPDEWRWVQLFEAADCRAAAKVDSASLKDTDWVLDLEDIDGDAGKVIATATFAERRSLSTKASFKKGDVLYGKLRPYLNKVVVADRSGFCTTEIIPLRPQPFVAAGYLRFFLRSQTFLRYAAQKNYGMKMPRLGTKDLEAAEIPLPPLAEQRRIVAKVDELMALCDRLERQQQERETRHAALARASLARFAEAPTPANLDFLFHPSYAIPPADLRKAILTLAVQGKLVPHDPNDEPADEIIRRIEAERINVIELPIDETELPWSLPSCWTWVRLGGIANIKHGYAFSSESFTSNPTPYVLTTPGNFHESGGFRDRGPNTKYFNGEIPPSFVFNAGDLIIPMTEQAAGLLGSPAFIPNDGKSYLHNQRLGKLEFYSDEVLPAYVYWFFNCEFFRGELARTCTGMKVRHTSPKRILKVPFALPPLAEQHRIVAKVEQLMALADALETQLAASRATAAKLLAALVAELTAAAPAQPPAPAARAAAPAPSHEPDFARVVLTAEIIGRLHDHDTFGQVKLQKLLHLVEYIFQLPEIDSHPLRYAAGPHDPGLIREVEQGLRVREWFAAESRADGPGHVYRPLAGAASHREVFAQLWPEKAPRIRAFLDELRAWKTERCERFATLYAAWNDLLLWGRQPSDTDIVEEVLERWDPAKKRIPRDLWEDSLRWMREHGYIPTGFGRATQSAPQAELPLG